MSTMIDRDNRRKVRDSLAHYLLHTNTKDQPHVRAERILQLIEGELGRDSIVEEDPMRTLNVILKGELFVTFE